jgi:nucleoid-associated protein YgaU
MIERVSRYYDGPLAQIKYKYTSNYTISVFRKFSKEKKVDYIEYTWVDGDSLGQLADYFIGGSKYWWEIMEINPEISDPFKITPGTIIRIPYDGK